MKYDRTLSDDFAKHLEKDGALRWLYDYVKKNRDLDFLIGKISIGENKNREWISIYRGLTKIISISQKDSEFILMATDSVEKIDSTLFEWRQLEESFENKLDGFLKKIREDKKFDRYFNNKKEGYYQNEFSRQFGICGNANDDFVIVDKEAVICYSNDSERKDRLSVFREKYVSILKSISEKNPKRFGRNRENMNLGNELDFLALDKEGNVLLIEFKDGSNTSGIYLSPFQIGMYYDLFTDVSQEEFKKPVVTMVEQKKRIGLINSEWEIPSQIKSIIPVLIIANHNAKSSALVKFNEILEISRKELGEKFLESIQVYNYSAEYGLSKIKY